MCLYFHIYGAGLSRSANQMLQKPLNGNVSLSLLKSAALLMSCLEINPPVGYNHSDMSPYKYLGVAS